MAAASHPSSWIARLRKQDTKLTPLNIRLMHIMTPLDHSKAVRELGWNPSPTPEAIREAARFFKDTRRKSTNGHESR